MTWIRRLVLLALLLVALPAHAFNCRQWTRMDPAQREQTLIQETKSRVYGQAAKKYNVSKPRIERCMMGMLGRISYDIDDTCADSRTADMQALNRILTNYIVACVNM